MKLSWSLGLVTLAVAALGFGPCRMIQNEMIAPSPVVFSQQPSLAELIQFRNLSTTSVRTLQTTGATITVRGMPSSLRAEVFYESPRSFRLRAGTGFTGGELDLGSNAELFWVWVKRNSPAATFYARHDQYAVSPARQHMPVEPSWLIEAIGLVTFDPNQQHQGPIQIAADRLEIRTPLPSPQGELIRSTTIHAQYGYVLEQKILDRSQKLLAAAVCSRHQYDSATGTSLPLTVAIQVPAADMEFTLDVGAYIINQPIAGGPATFMMPQYDGYPAIDLADPRLPGPAQLPPPGTAYPGPLQPLPGATQPVAPQYAPAPAPATQPWPAAPTGPSTPLPPNGSAYPGPPAGGLYPSARADSPRYRGFPASRE